MDPVWSKAPLLLALRYRKIFVAVLGSAILLGLASTAGPLFLSASGSAALAEDLEGQPPLFNGFQIGYFGSFGEPEERNALNDRNDLLSATAGRQEHLGDPVFTLLGPNRDFSPVGDPESVEQIRLVSRTDLEGHLEVLEGDAGGFLIADSTASDLGVSVGDELQLLNSDQQLEISGIYAALATAPPDPFWANFGGLIFPDPTGATPPAFGFLSQDAMQDLGEATGLQGNSFWEYPLIGELSIEKADELARFMLVMERGVNENETIGEGTQQELAEDWPANGQVIATFPGLVNAAHRTVTALEGPVLVLSLAGRLVALAVIAAAGAYLIVSRKTETQLLSARGMTPVQQGTRSALEALLATLLGVALGAVAGHQLVIAVGPSDLIASGDIKGAVYSAGYTLIVGLFVLGLVAALTVRAATSPVERRGNSLMRFLWEIPVLVLAGAAYYEITTRDSIIIEGSSGDRIDIFVLLFPILFLLGVAGLLARALRFTFSRAKALSRDRSSATYLASRRLASAPNSIVGLLIAAVLAVGILVYAQSLAQTIRFSSEAKAGVFVGSDVQLQVYATSEIPSDFPMPLTRVRKIARLNLTNGTRISMMGVDPATFERSAYWSDAFADRSLSELMDSLEPVPGEPLPVIVAGGEDSVESQPSIDLGTDLELNPVEFVTAFPGMTADQPLIVSDIDGMTELFSGINSAATANATTELWIEGERDDALQAAADNDIPVGLIRTSQEVLNLPTLASVSWAFDLLRALGVAAGAIALVAVLLYMQARQRSTVVSYAMARRMGLSRNQHARALAFEIAAILTVAIAAGSLMAIAVARMVYGYLDLLPRIPPAPILQVPSIIVIGVLGLGIISAVVGALLVQRGADRARVAEVLRLAE
jgi:putative ABC transport system permease protein